MTAVRLALIGAGVIGKRHLDAIAATGSADLVAIADPLPASAQIAQDQNVPWFDDFTTMFEAIAPDGVIIATPTEHHLSPTLAALSLGCHVLVEKPIAATNDEAAQISAASARHHRHVLVGHHRRYYGLVERARGILHDGTLGQLVAVNGQWNVRKHDAYYEPDWRKKWQAGPILTNFIHDMDLLRYLLGDLVSISADTSNQLQNFEKEDAAALIMRFQSGVLGTFIMSDQSQSPWSWEFATGENPAFPKSGQNALRFMGTTGALEFPQLMIWRSSGPIPSWNVPMERQDVSVPLEDAFVRQIDHFAAVIQGKSSPRITAADAAQTLRAVLAVYEASSSGQRIML